MDEERVSRWIGGNDAVGWKVQEELDKQWAAGESLEGMNEINRTGPENSGNNDSRADDLQLSNDWRCNSSVGRSRALNVRN